MDLPSDISAERSVLGAILIRERISDVLGTVDIDDFMLPAHREIYETMLDLSAARSPLDVQTLASEMDRRGSLKRLEGNELYLLELTSGTPTAENVRFYAGVVRERATARRLMAACLEAASRAKTEKPDDVLADLRGHLAGLHGEVGGPITFAEAMPGYLEGLESRADRKEVFRVASGIVALDRKLLGGAPMGNVIVVGGRPGMGKSAFAFTWAMNAARAGTPALVISLEMKHRELMDRGLSYFSGIDGARIATGHDLPYEIWKTSIHPASKSMMDMPLAIDDRKLTCDQIVSEVMRWRAKHATRLAIVVIDYLQLIKASRGRRSENRSVEVGEWCRAMKILAGDANVALVLVSQLNRKSEEGGVPTRPGMTDLRDSGEIEQHADTILFPFRDGPVAEIGIPKNRGADVGIVGVRWNGPTTSFHDEHRSDLGSPYAD